MSIFVGIAVLAGALTGCSGGGGDSKGNGNSLDTVSVTVSRGAYVEADKDGGDELTGVQFAQPAQAVCSTGQRVGVIAQQVDTDEVEAWTNATEKPVVFVDPDDLDGELSRLGPCSMGYAADELDGTVLHGDRLHASHAS